MTRSKDIINVKRRRYPAARHTDQPLLRVLIAEATRRGDTLAAMASALGVTYEHVAQWRRHDADVSKATRSVIEAAAQYLGVPTVMVLCLAGTIGLRDMMYPGRASRDAFVRQELARLRADPCLAGFFPDALLTAPPEIQQFVVTLYREVAHAGARDRTYEWMKSLHLAALGNVEGEAALASIRAAAGGV